MEKYSLVGLDGNAFSIISYTGRALKKEGLGSLVDEMREQAMSGDYYNVIAVCGEYLDKANEAADENGYINEDEE